MTPVFDLSCPGLTFNAEKHEYFMHGERVPNVTSILDDVIGDTAKIHRDVLRRSRILGDAVHYACELDDLRTLDEATVGYEVAGYLRAWRKFKDEHKVCIHNIETRLFHPTHKYCGTTDRVMHIDDLLTVVDLKTGTPWPSHGPQTAAYHAVVNMKTGAGLDRACVYLKEDGRYLLRFETNREDWGVFLSCLTVYNFKRRNNGH
jgi:hypothetical protein